MTLHFAFTEKTEGGRWAVKRKEHSEGGEPVVCETFDDEGIANQYRDLLNERLLVLKYEASQKPVVKNDELPTEEIKNVAVAAEGNWVASNGMKFKATSKVLDAMVANFHELKKRGMKPYLKLGHLSSKDHIKATGMPALGWVTDLRRVGEKVVADFSHVPRKVAQLIRARSYARVSPEIVLRYADPVGGKNYGNVLRAVGLLGATTPAMTTLDDIISNLFEGFAPPDELMTAAATFGPQDTGIFTFSMPFEEVAGDATEGEIDMDPKELQELKDRLTALEAQSTNVLAALGFSGDASKGKDVIVEITRLVGENATTKKALEEQTAVKFSADVDALIAKAKTDGKLLPAAEAGIRKMIDGWKKDTTDGVVEFELQNGKPAKGTVVECLKAYFEAQPKLIAIGVELGAPQKPGARVPASVLPADIRRQAEHGQFRDARVVSFESADVDAQVRAFMVQHKINNYAEAFDRMVLGGEVSSEAEATANA